MTRRDFLPLAGTGLLTAPMILDGCTNDTLKVQLQGDIKLPGTVVFATRYSGRWSIGMARFDSISPTDLSRGSFAEDTQPIWIDNGQKIIFVSDRGGSPDLYRINDVHDPENSTEPLTDLAGEVRFPELSPDGRSVFFCHKSPTTPLWRICQFDLVDNALTDICTLPAGKSQLRFLDSTNLLIGPIKLGEIDLNTGTFTKYIYNHIDVTSFDTDCSVATFDVSRKTGKAYVALDNSPFGYYRVFSWNYSTADGYLTLAGGAIEWNDVWRGFRVLDLGGSHDVVLGSQRTAAATLDIPHTIGPF